MEKESTGIMKKETELPQSERVDFNSATSILNYGENTLNQIKGLTEAVVNMKGNAIHSTAIMDEEQAIQKVATFSEYVKEEIQKKPKPKSTKSLISKIRDWALSSENEEEELTFKELYDKYIKIIDDVKTDIQKNMATTQEEINLSEEFINKLTPGLLKLKALIDCGYHDLKEYENNLYLPQKEKLVEDNTNEELKYQVTLSGQIIDMFRNRLNELQGAYQVLSNSRIESQAIKAGNINLLIVYQGIMSTSLPALEIAAINSVATEIQKKKINSVIERRKEINQTIIDNSNTLLTTLGKISDEYGHGTIESATIETLVTNSQQMVEQLNRALVQRRENNIREDQVYQKNVVLLEKQAAIIDSISLDLSQNGYRNLPEYHVANEDIVDTDMSSDVDMSSASKRKSLFRK